MIETVELQGGFRVPASDQFGCKWAIQAQRLDFDEQGWEKFQQYVPEKGFVIDAGACVGMFTKFFSDKVGPDGLVLAFEPCPENFEVLEHNSRLFQHKNFYVEDRAVAHRRGYGNWSFKPENVGETRVDLRATGEISFVALDEFVPEVTERKVDFLKLDVEGWEFFALIGAFKLVRKDRPVMLIEINEPCLQAQGTDGQAVRSLLELMKYDVKVIQDHVPEGGVFDLLCLPRT